MSDLGIRWGAVLPQGTNQEFAGMPAADAWRRMLDSARLAEDLGYDEVWLTECADTAPRRSAEIVFDAWVALGAVAAATERVGLGCLVPCTPYHHPGELAKRLSTLDVAAGGRVEVALGAGAHPSGYESYGWQPPRPEDRAAVLDEHVRALRRLWAEPTVDLSGEHVRMRDAHSAPRPVAGSVPLLLTGAAAGDDLRLAARHADQVLWQGSPAEVAAARARLRDACAEIGREPGDVGDAVLLECRIFDDTDQRDRWLASPWVIVFWSTHPDNYCERNLVGTVDAVTGQVSRYLEAGVRRMLLWFRDYPEQVGLRTFRTEVVPRVGGVEPVQTQRAISSSA